MSPAPPAARLLDVWQWRIDLRALVIYVRMGDVRAHVLSEIRGGMHGRPADRLVLHAYFDFSKVYHNDD